MKILLIRRDNIGDLILTTPLIATLAGQKNTSVDLLVNTYNKDVLEGNPHIGKVHLYCKSHHRKPGQTLVGVYLQRLKTILSIRLARYDVAIVGSSDKRPLLWAKLSGAKRIIAIGNESPECVTDQVLPLKNVHIVESLNALATPLGINETPGPLELYVSEHEVAQMAAKYPLKKDLPVYGLQISARKPKQRWQIDKFIELAHRLCAREACQLVLFWSPGASDNPEHPGDDLNAQRIISACEDINLTAIPTRSIRELMAAMSLCDQIITSDGGALHIAAGVHKPVVALFGNSDACYWGPWQVPCAVIKAPEENVGLLEVDDVCRQFIELREKVLTPA
ncbi:glycosyltransferase family 9 protein [Rahnella sp. SAP-1]|uniref:Glycosyltransferase family 9 protein n=1 Tax=Rouxiella aceris TaxID=2703884 RepID=A0A848MPE2_9GAMM|nr:glycosyltransferase family 9 protein [Rouxiella aceris]NMP28732.1 glycosyltransferase family 9 protein [Rouxiella aceris]